MSELLIMPGSFPSSPDQHGCNLRIADTDISVRFPGDDHCLSSELKPFLHQDPNNAKSDIILDLTGSHNFCPPQSLQPGSGPAFTSVHRGPDEFWFRRAAGYLWTNSDFSTCRAWSPDGGPPLPREDYNGRPWMMLAVWGYLSRRGGALMHGAVCVLDNQSYVLLLGDRQTGKSTLGRLVVQAGFSCLTDEYPIVTIRDEYIYVHGTPWPGIRGTSAPLSGPLKAIFFLGHGSHNSLDPLSPRKATSALLNTIRFFSWDRSTTLPALDLMDKTAGTVPIYDFKFVPTTEAVDTMREKLCTSV